MSLVGHPFPYDIDNLLSGAVSILYAPLGDDDPGIPDSIDDIFLTHAPYTPVTGWNHLGATKESFTYHRSFDAAGLEIQQVAGAILEETTDIARSIELSMAEFNPFGFQLMENAPTVDTIAAAANKSAQKRIPFGNFASPERYRFAFVSRRPRASGLVTEPTTLKTRGRFVVGVGYQGQLAADDVSMEQGKGDLTAVGLTFTLFPETDIAQDEGEETGAWFIEEAGVIAAS